MKTTNATIDGLLSELLQAIEAEEAAAARGDDTDLISWRRETIEEKILLERKKLAIGQSGFEEPWDVASGRLKVLPSSPTREEVLYALAPLGYTTTTLDYSEGSRVLGLAGCPPSRAKSVMTTAKRDGRYDAVELLAAMHGTRKAQSEKSRSATAYKQAISRLPAIDQQQIESARAAERSAIEEARAYEALTKTGSLAPWRGRSMMATANEATRYRKQVEERLLRAARLT